MLQYLEEIYNNASNPKCCGVVLLCEISAMIRIWFDGESVLFGGTSVYLFLLVREPHNAS